MSDNWTRRTTASVICILGLILIVGSWLELTYHWGLVGLGLVIYSLWFWLKTNG
ncbi:MAG: hypothetical protein KKF65_04705 [Nanoarchaeota archaeon]|nr:hypothetical protein [Nanoarchaeota archaeon]